MTDQNLNELKKQLKEAKNSKFNEIAKAALVNSIEAQIIEHKYNKVINVNKIIIKELEDANRQGFLPEFITEDTKNATKTRLEALRKTATDRIEAHTNLIKNKIERAILDNDKQVLIAIDVLTPVSRIIKALLNVYNSKVLTDSRKRLAIAIDDKKFYSLNSNNLMRLVSLFNEKGAYANMIVNDNTEEATGSDKDIMELSNDVHVGQLVTIEIIDTHYQGYDYKNGGWFKYNHKLKYDLKRYGLYSVDDDFINIKDNCFMTCLINSGKFTEIDINSIKIKMTKNMISRSELKNLAIELKTCIYLHYTQKSGNKELTYINKKDINNKVLEMCLIDDHYFLYETVNINSYAIINYDDVKNIKEWFYIHKYDKVKKCYKKDKNRSINTYTLVNLLLAHKDKLLVNVTFDPTILGSIHFDEYKIDFNNLNYKDTNIKKNEYSVKQGPLDSKTLIPIDHRIAVFDFETTTEGKHKPYLLCARFYTRDFKSFTSKSYKGDNLIINFLNDLQDNDLCYAHNLGYDIRFIIPHLHSIKSTIQKSESKILFMEATHKLNNSYINIRFQCTLAMIPEPLAKFSKMFNLESKKEVIPYALYTEKTVKLPYVRTSYALKLLKSDSEREDMLKNIKDWGLEIKDKEGYFKHIEYSKIYCEHDVKVTAEGFITFNSWLEEYQGLDAVNYKTIAGLSDDFLNKEGCFKGCYKLSGMPRAYIQNCIVGGRVMCNDNKKVIVEKLINALDAKSLYPSAMKRLGEELGGYLKGKPKVLEIKTKEFIFSKNITSFFIRINITKVNKRREFSLLSKINEKGIRVSTNDALGITFVDKITLEDYIKYQEIEYEVLDGYYFNEGRNNTITNVIDELYNTRTKFKKEGNPAEQIYKLIMNSSYGKTCLKPIDDSIVFVPKYKSDKFLIKFYNNVIYRQKIDNSKTDKFKILKPIDDHFNSVHIGCEILSMSKRIMNEVMTLAEDNNIKIYYQDTDSMHIEEEHIPRLRELFMKKFNRELVGSNMGQFGSDFNAPCDKGREKETLAVKGIFLGKKCYVDKLKYIKDGKVEYTYKTTMKGIPKGSIDVKVKNEYNDDYMALYQDLYDGKEVEFDLLAGMKVCFVANRDYTIETRQEFKRKVKF